MKNMLLLLFLYVVWGTTYTAIVYALEGFEPFVLAAWRFLFAGLIFAPFTKINDWKWSNAWPHILGGIGLATGNALVVWSQTAMPSGLAALFVGSVPLWMIALDWSFFSRRRPHFLSIAGCLVGLAGLYFLSVQTGKDLTLRSSAIALIGAAFLWSLGTLIIRHGKSPLPRRSALAIQLVFGGIFQFVIAFFHGENFIPTEAAFSLKPFLAWSYLVLFGSVLAMRAYNYLLPQMDSAVIGTYALANPVVALLLGHWLFGESLDLATVMAGVLVLFGVGLILMAGKLRAIAITPKLTN